MNFITNVELRSNDPKEVKPQLREALKNYKVVKITPGWHISNLRSFYDELIEVSGEVVNIGEDFKNQGKQTGERWMEIRYDHDIPDMSAFRHSKNAQPLHTDASYISDPCNVMFFYAVNKAKQGGNTTFVDGNRLIKHMKEDAPELLDRLINTNVTYRKADQSRTEKIIDLSNPELPVFNFNYFCIDPSESEENKELNKSFFDYLQSNVAFTYMAHKVGLAPGEAVAWWDNYVLHGRDAYNAEKTNDRFIWKAGTKWKD